MNRHNNKKASCTTTLEGWYSREMFASLYDISFFSSLLPTLPLCWQKPKKNLKWRNKLFPPGFHWILQFPSIISNKIICIKTHLAMSQSCAAQSESLSNFRAASVCGFGIAVPPGCPPAWCICSLEARGSSPGWREAAGCSRWTASSWPAAALAARSAQMQPG